MNDKPTITTIKDGPYILAGLDELRDFSGKSSPSSLRSAYAAAELQNQNPFAMAPM